MKIRIKTYNGELPSYLTVGKVYESTGLFDGDEESPYYILNDKREHILICIYDCDHLNGGSWEVVSDL